MDKVKEREGGRERGLEIKEFSCEVSVGHCSVFLCDSIIDVLKFKCSLGGRSSAVH